MSIDSDPDGNLATLADGAASLAHTQMQTHFRSTLGGLSNHVSEHIASLVSASHPTPSQLTFALRTIQFNGIRLPTGRCAARLVRASNSKQSTCRGNSGLPPGHFSYHELDTIVARKHKDVMGNDIFLFLYVFQ